jgi:MSHA biogenesis protein MshL
MMNMKLVQALVIGVVLGLAGCSTSTEKPVDTAEQERLEAERRAQQAKANAAALKNPPPEVTAALLPPLNVNLAAPVKEEERRYNVSVNRVNSRSFFMGLVKGTPDNMIVHPDVKGTITLELDNVTTQEVMELVRDVYGYEFEKRGHNYIVSPRRMQSKMYHVNYLNLRRVGESRTTIISGELSKSRQSSTSQGDSVATPSTTSESSSSGRNITGGSQVRTSSETDLWNGLITAIQDLIGTGEGRKVIATPQASLVLVRAMPAELREVEQYLASLEENVERQVILEAKILEVQLDEGFQAGINWAALASVNGNPVIVGQTGGGTLFEGQDGLGSLFQSSQFTGIQGNTGDLAGGPLPSGTAVEAFGGVFTVAAQFSNFAAFLELLETQGQVNVLSSPRISTVSNQKAIIKVGNDEYFVTNISSTTTTTAATSTNFPNVELTPFFSGVALDVMPQIGIDDEITLHIHPSVTDVKDDPKELVIGSELVSLPLAKSTIRESDNIVHVRSGQMVVIGGLMSTIEQDLDGGVPWFKDIPVVGNAFKHKKKALIKSEVVILLKPIIVDGGLKWENEKHKYNKAIQDASLR